MLDERRLSLDLGSSELLKETSKLNSCSNYLNEASSVVHYARRYLPLMNRQSSFDDANSGTKIPYPLKADQRALLEDIVGLIPKRRFDDANSGTKISFHASGSYRENLEKRVGAQLDQASLIDLLIPNMGYSETLYDIDCVQRMLDHFLLVEQDASIATLCYIVDEEGQSMNLIH